MTSGFAPLMSAEDVATLKRDRIVVIDDVLPAEVLALVQEEARAMAREGRLKGESNSTCNPGEQSIEMPLWDHRKLKSLQQQHPGLYHCVRALWNLPAMLGPALGAHKRAQPAPRACAGLPVSSLDGELAAAEGRRLES